MNLLVVCSRLETLHQLARKLRHDHLLVRASALAYDTLLAIVPLMAVSLGTMGALGGRDLLASALRELAAQYVPSAAGEAVERLISLAETLDLHTIGLFGLVALLPVVFALVDSVEHALADVFGTPRRTHWFRLLLLGFMLSLAPLGSVLSVRYVPKAQVQHLFGSFVLLFLLLYTIFRRLPAVEIRDRAAAMGALSAASTIAVAKVGFGLYANHLAISIHALWGAIAFVPLFLLWVLLCWYAVLVAAAIAATLQNELALLEAQQLPQGPARRPSWVEKRNRRRRRYASRTQSHPRPSLDELP